MSASYDHLFKVLILGDSGVGKSSKGAAHEAMEAFSVDFG